MVATDEVLIPIQCEYYALEGLGQLLNNIEMVKSHLNPRLEVSTVLLTMYDGRTKLADQVAAEVRRHFGPKVLDMVIPRSVKVSEAPGFGQSVMTYDPGSRGATSYLDAAQGNRRTRREGDPMTRAKGGLGRGLAALIPTGTSDNDRLRRADERGSGPVGGGRRSAASSRPTAPDRPVAQAPVAASHGSRWETGATRRDRTARATRRCRSISSTPNPRNPADGVRRGRDGRARTLDPRIRPAAADRGPAGRHSATSWSWASGAGGRPNAPA